MTGRDLSDAYFVFPLALRFPWRSAREALQFGRSTRLIPGQIELFEEDCDGLIIPRGLPLDGFDIESVQDNRNSHPVQISTTIKNRDYQDRIIRIAVDEEGGVIVAPTGAGKTAMGIEIAARLGERCLILVKSLDLAKQWQGAIKQFTGLECGLIGGGKRQEGLAFTVGLTQTLVKQDVSLDYGLVIVDECHNIPAKQAYTVINRQTAKHRFGLSATPQRRDNLEFMIHAALDPVIAEVNQSELEGAVLPVTVATLEYNFKGNPDGWSEFINLLALDSQRNRLLVTRAINSSRVTGTALLSATVSHAEELYRLIKLGGITLYYCMVDYPRKSTRSV